MLKLFLVALFATGTFAQYDYSLALHKSLLFYEAQRSGALPADNRIDWRGDSALGDFVQGGYYDAGDHVKFGFPMASMMTQIAWGAITFEDGYKSAGEIDYLYDCLKWGTDYFIAAHPSDNVFYGQIGDGDVDHAWWGRPEDMTMNRPEFAIDTSKPGSDLAGETAAALAAASIFYRNNGYTSDADECLNHAQQLMSFADQYRAKYSDSIPNAGNFYNSWSGYNDELAWGAIWLFKATGDPQYLTMAEAYFRDFGLDLTPTEFGWDNKVAGVQALLYEATGNTLYSDCVNNFVGEIQGKTYSPGGMVYVDQWGTLRHAANLAHWCLQVSNMGLQTSFCPDFAETQMRYILGNNPKSISYQIGYGSAYPEQPHHRGSSCPDMPAECDWDEYNNPGPNYQVLEGALVGGPDNNDQYTDSRSDYVHNEVATDYNAGFQSALAGLIQRGL